MGLYNFKQQFEADIMADRKRHTIRGKRRYPDKPGSTCHLFVGLRTKKARLLKRRQCTKVQWIRIHEQENGEIGICIGAGGWFYLSPDEKERFARSDGFPNFAAMTKIWQDTHNKKKRGKRKPLDFRGDLIHWESDAEYFKRIPVDAEFIPRRARKAPTRRKKQVAKR